ncbi:hypothetical protein AgCh_028489 [Apium graveolens]
MDALFIGCLETSSKGFLHNKKGNMAYLFVDEELNITKGLKSQRDMEIYELREQLKDILEELNRKDSYHSPHKKDNKYAHKSDLKEQTRHIIRKSKDDGNSLRLDIPKFDGSMDPEIFVEWLKHVEWVIDYKDYDDHKRFKVVRSKLKGYANLWYELLKSKWREEESHGVNQDTISFDDYTIGFEKNAQIVAHSCVEISLKYDALKKDDDDTTHLAFEDQLFDLNCNGYEHVQEESLSDLVMNMRDTENISMGNLLRVDSGVRVILLEDKSFIDFLGMDNLLRAYTKSSVGDVLVQEKNSIDLLGVDNLLEGNTNSKFLIMSMLLPKNNSKWRDEFVSLTWAGGDWASLFHRPFSKVVDGSPSSIRLTDEEEAAYQALIADNGQIDTWTLLEEFSLKKVGLSQATDKACKAINNLNKPKEGESGRQKRAKLTKDPRGKPDGPSFLKPHAPDVSLGNDVDPPIKGHAYRPNWSFRRGDTVVGSTKHAKDWYFHSITPQDYTEIVMGSDIESIEHLGSQAQASSNAFFQAALHQAKSWKDNSDEFEREMKKWKERVEILDKKLKSKGKELSKAHFELVKLRSDKETLIDEYMDS